MRRGDEVSQIVQSTTRPTVVVRQNSTSAVVQRPAGTTQVQPTQPPALVEPPNGATQAEVRVAARVLQLAAAGPTGPQGPEGPEGPKGDPGEDGAAQIPDILDGGNF